MFKQIWPGEKCKINTLKRKEENERKKNKLKYIWDKNIFTFIAASNRVWMIKLAHKCIQKEK